MCNEDDEKQREAMRRIHYMSEKAGQLRKDITEEDRLEQEMIHSGGYVPESIDRFRRILKDELGRLMIEMKMIAADNNIALI